VASGDIFTSLQPRDLFYGNGPQQALLERTDGPVGGLPLGKAGVTNKVATAGGDTWYSQFRVNVNGTPLSTGATVQLLWTDDPQNPSPGNVAVVGVSMARLQSGTTDYASVSWGTETTVQLTAPSTPTVATLTAAAVTKANMGTPSAGDFVALRIRRLPNNSSDTHAGRVLLLGASIQDT
jgi:hypothetical protein